MTLYAHCRARPVVLSIMPILLGKKIVKYATVNLFKIELLGFLAH